MIGTEKLAQAITLIDEFVQMQPPDLPTPPPPPPTVTCTLTDNLPAILSELPGGAIVDLPAGFVHSGSLTPTKPVTLRGGTLIGPVILGAPDVTFQGVTLKGINKDHNILTLADRAMIDRCRIVGHVTGQLRGIRAEAADCQILRTSITNIWHGNDTQCISGDNGTKRLLIEDCWLEASGENIIFGGGDPTSEANIPQDITIRRCYMGKPLDWRGKAGCTVKNLFELKNVKRVLVEDCLMAHSWVSGQIGFAIVLSVRNQGNTAPYSTIEDVIIRNTRISHCAGGIQLLGMDYTNPSVLMKRVTFEDLIIEDINQTAWGTNGRCVQLQNGCDDLTFRRVRCSGVNINSAMTFVDGSPTFARLVVDSCEFPEGEYGIKSTAGIGTAVLEAYAPGYTWTNNTIRCNVPRPRVIAYPPGTVLV